MTKPTQAQIEAKEDALFYGTGFLRNHADGSMERIDPREMVITKPTRAQIEAATAAVYAASEKYPRYATIQMNMILAEDYATAALTAAAEVEPMKEIQQYEAMIARNKAAAEVGVGSYSVAEVHRIVEQTAATTIERCAQVAEQYEKMDTHRCGAISAAIRKLKEGK